MIYLGKQEVTFGGHQDNGALFTNEQETSKTNDRNFWALLRYATIRGDKDLENLLLHSSRKQITQARKLKMISLIALINIFPAGSMNAFKKLNSQH